MRQERIKPAEIIGWAENADRAMRIENDTDMVQRVDDMRLKSTKQLFAIMYEDDNTTNNTPAAAYVLQMDRMGSNTGTAA